MRLFIAVDIPDDLKEYLSNMRVGDSGKVSWVKKENLHITLKFLGDVKEEDVDTVRKVLNGIKFEDFSLVVDKIGFFPNENHIKVVWVGFKETEKLFELHKLVDMSLSKMFGMENGFLGHITLARVKFLEDKNGFVEKLKNVELEQREFRVDGFTLYKSTLTPEGPVYEVVDEHKNN